MFFKKNILLVMLLFSLSLSVVSAVDFDISLGYHQTSSSYSMTELEK